MHHPIRRLHRWLLVRLRRYRRLVLSELVFLNETVDATGYTYLDPQDLLGRPGNPKYLGVVNALLSEELIRGVDAGEGRVAFSVNPRRLSEVKRELAWWRDPFWQFVVGTLVAAAGIAIPVSLT